MKELLERAAALRDDVRAWRRHLHRRPELSFQEHETTRFVADKLRSFGVATERPAETGVVGVIEGAGAGRTVALRADIDALPIHEEQQVPYRSEHDGVMHACGHDGHTAMLLGAARVLAEHRQRFRGRVKLLFQAAEELPPGGARQLVEAGVLEDVDALAGMHLIADVPVGRAAIRNGAMMAHSDRFAVEIEGRGGHGASPHQAVDAVAVAAQVVCHLQTVVSRRVNPVDPAVVTVGRIQSGSAFNVVAGRAWMEGTARCFDDELRERLPREIRRVAEHTCAAAGAECRVEYTFGYPALVNDAGVADVLRSAAAAELGQDRILEQRPVMSGEDFAYYCREIPAAFLFLGAGSARADAVYPHHHPRFSIDEESLAHGVPVLLRTALALLEHA